jgi:hypothetical protein
MSHALVRGLVMSAVVVLVVLLAACAPPPSSSPGESASAEPTASASPTASSGEPAAGVVVTFRVGDEEYRILLTDPADIEIARRLLAGEEAPPIPNGRIVRGDDGGVNTGYSWHIDPDSVEFADFTIEVCDGVPSFVEDGTLTGDQFCPWSAEVIAIEE